MLRSRGLCTCACFKFVNHGCIEFLNAGVCALVLAPELNNAYIIFESAIEVPVLVFVFLWPTACCCKSCVWCAEPITVLHRKKQWHCVFRLLVVCFSSSACRCCARQLGSTGLRLFKEAMRTPGRMRPARFRVMGAINHAGEAESVTVSPHESCVNLARHCKVAAVSQRLGSSSFRPSVTVCSQAEHSLREQEDMLRRKFARQLVVLARGVASESVVLSSLADRRDDQLEFFIS